MEAIFLFFVPLFLYLCFKVAIFRDIDEIKVDSEKFQKGILLFETGLITESLVYFETITLENSKSALVYFYRAKCHFKLENYFQSIYYCDKASSLSNEIPEVFLIKGISLFHIEDFEAARKELSKAIWYFHEKNQESFFWRAKTFQKLNLEAEAKKDFAQSKKLLSKNN